MSAEKLAQVNAAWEDEQEDDGAEEQVVKPAQVVKMPQQDMDKLQDHHQQQQQQQQEEEEPRLGYPEAYPQPTPRLPYAIWQFRCMSQAKKHALKSEQVTTRN